jgi:hypothetical protein
VRFLALVGAAALLLAGCSDEEPPLTSENVSAAELRTLVPPDLLPAGFSEVPPDPDLPPGLPTPDVPHHIAAYADSLDNRFFIGIFATGKVRLAKDDSVEAKCQIWREYAETPSCPMTELDRPDVGDDALAFISSGGDESVRGDLFVRDGIEVGITVQDNVLDAGTIAALLAEIDTRIQELAASKRN